MANAQYDINELRQQYLKPPSQWPKPSLAPDIKHRELGLLPLPTFPADNPLTLPKLILGEKLFHDPKLSRSNQIACASCHDLDLGWGDGRTTSFGHNRLKGNRNAPPVENSAYSSTLFWDGRAATLEQQALMPITNPIEMNFSLPELSAKLMKIKEYRQLFKAAFGTESINETTISQAIATYERTIISRYSAFDRFLQTPSATTERRRTILNAQFSDQAVLGLHLFRTKAQCLNCHNGPTMSDNEFHNIGLTYYKRQYQDLGRYNITGKANDVGKFKTPSLRGVMNSKPWMHNGLFADMRGIISLYNRGGPRNRVDPNDPLSPVQSPLIKPLELTQEEQQALFAFMEAVTAPPALGPSFRLTKDLQPKESKQ